jgi:hypothetical protein
VADVLVSEAELTEVLLVWEVLLVCVPELAVVVLV